MLIVVLLAEVETTNLSILKPFDVEHSIILPTMNSNFLRCPLVLLTLLLVIFRL
jgi:hypothetical protein